MQDLLLNDKTGKVGVDTAQQAHIEDLLRADLGYFKHAPVFGTGAKRALHSDRIQEAAQRLRIQAQAMKIRIQTLNINNDQWHITL